jgi:hypothetical protein
MSATVATANVMIEHDFLPTSAPVGGDIRRREESSRGTIMSTKNAAPRPQEDRLDHRYGEIGISALVATLRYLGDTKNPAYAPVDPQPDERYVDVSA